jgi:hypothetical protein
MLYPFYPDDRRGYLKPASYEVCLGGPYVYWDDAGIKRDEDIGNGEPFVLQANSIAFVTLQPRFRIPAYIAVRFNLRISHIYKGLLLGTGPLVDPGFRGRLSIPLHNLTINDYTLLGGDGLIWMEFTKLSPNDRIERPRRPHRRAGTFVEFEPEKLDLNLTQYLQKAAAGFPVRSSIPEAILKSEAAVRNADAAANRLRNFGIGAAILIVLAIAGLVFQGFTLVDDMNGRIDNLQQKLSTGGSATSTSTPTTTTASRPTTSRP